MPTVSTSELPKPKIWDEFEDIIWNLYSRKWRDPNARRNGRQGQRQHGVDIYGQPARMDGKYCGIQCKCRSEGNLTKSSIEAEVEEAGNFTPPLTEYMIVTTLKRDSVLQQDVRKINSIQRKRGKFAVGIVFWADVCNELANPENHDLLRKYYSNWFEVFRHSLPRESLQFRESEFSRHTKRTLQKIETEIPGIEGLVPREEISRVEDQLGERKPVVLTGDAGTGKSGIAFVLTETTMKKGHVPLLLDARGLGHVQNEAELREYFSLKTSLSSEIGRIGGFRGVRLLIDQLDNVVGLPSASVLIDLAVECSEFDGVEVVVISRRRESHEQRLLERLASAGFVELTSYPLSEAETTKILSQMGISRPSDGLVALGRNLLNLQLVGKIKQRNPDFDFAALMDEVILWEKYVSVILVREEIGNIPQSAEQVIAEAVRLAKEGLKNEDKSFRLDYPVKPQQSRLVSGGILQCEGRVCRFYHEKLQDYLYSWDATERGLMPVEVLDEVPEYRSRNVLAWMEEIYARRRGKTHIQFMKELFSVG